MQSTRLFGDRFLWCQSCSLLQCPAPAASPAVATVPGATASLPADSRCLIAWPLAKFLFQRGNFVLRSRGTPPMLGPGMSLVGNVLTKNVIILEHLGREILAGKVLVLQVQGRTCVSRTDWCRTGCPDEHPNASENDKKESRLQANETTSG